MNDSLQLPIDVCQIQELLPHRYPFLLVDRVLELDVEAKRILAQKNVSINEPFFQGHFPGRPIMPGVLIIEALAQAGGVMTQLTLGRDAQSKLFYMVKVENARFNKQVVPGDVLMLDVQMKRLIRNMGWYYGEAKVNGEVVASAEVMCAAPRADPLEAAMTDNAPRIHPTAVIDPAARLADDVQVGAFTLIGPDVEIGAGTVSPHCSIHGPTRIGRDNRFVGHAAIGGEPQDKKFAGERTELVIGDRNVFREFVTLNRGTGGGGGITTIGNDNWMLAYTHVAHDCHVGNFCVLQQHHPGRPRDRGRLRDHQRLRRCPPVLPHRCACLPRHGRADQWRCTAVHHGRYRFAGPPARHQQRRPEALRRRRPHLGHQACLPHAVRGRPAVGRSQAAADRTGA